MLSDRQRANRRWNKDRWFVAKRIGCGVKKMFLLVFFALPLSNFFLCLRREEKNDQTRSD